jgi:hypothetical protein
MYLYSLQIKGDSKKFIFTNPYRMDNTEGYRQTITPGGNSIVYLDLPAEGKDAVLKYFLRIFSQRKLSSSLKNGYLSSLRPRTEK